jgi:hypothetical protein
MLSKYGMSCGSRIGFAFVGTLRHVFRRLCRKAANRWSES